MLCMASGRLPTGTCIVSGAGAIVTRGSLHSGSCLCFSTRVCSMPTWVLNATGPFPFFHIETTSPGEPNMAPPAGFDSEQIRDKARKDLLYLLSVVSKASGIVSWPRASSWTSFIDSAPLPFACLGPGQEEPRYRAEPRRAHLDHRQGRDPTRLWSRQVLLPGGQ